MSACKRHKCRARLKMLNRLADKAAAADLYRFMALMDDFGVEHKVSLCPPIHYIPFSAGGYVVKVKQGAKNVEGYLGFYTMFEFGSDGSFDVVGAWE